MILVLSFWLRLFMFVCSAYEQVHATVPVWRPKDVLGLVLSSRSMGTRNRTQALGHGNKHLHQKPPFYFYSYRVFMSHDWQNFPVVFTSAPLHIHKANCKISDLKTPKTDSIHTSLQSSTHILMNNVSYPLSRYKVFVLKLWFCTQKNEKDIEIKKLIQLYLTSISSLF